MPKSFNRLIDKYINALFKTREVPEETRQELWNVYNKKLSDAVDQGYSPKIDFYDKDLAKSLKENIAVFSAFKEESFKNVLGSLLVDEKGGLRPWNEFKKEAAKVNSAYNERYLKTEYHQTIAAANAAQKWNDIERTKHLYPNLRYLTVGDNRVRDKHRAWHGKVLPIDHPFWVKNFPPNDWGCRCDTERTDDEPTIEKDIPKTFDNDKFKNNPGLTGKVFPETVYAAGITGDDFKRIYDWGIKQFEKLQNYNRNYKTYQRLKKDKNYFDVVFDKSTGGMKATHNLHNFNPKKGHYEKEAMEILFKKGNGVVFESEIALLGDTTPDGLLNNIVFDIKSIEGQNGILGKNNLKNKLIEGNRQGCKNVTLYFPDKNLYENGDQIRNAINRYLFNCKDKNIKPLIDDVWVVVNDEIKKFKIK